MRSLIVFGGTQGTGLEAVKLAVESGLRVVAFARHRSEELATLGVEQVCGNIEDHAAVKAAYRAAGAAGELEAVVCTISNGSGGSKGFKGVENVAKEALEYGRMRVVLISSLGAGESRAYASARLLDALGGVLAEKTRAECTLQKSGLPYTILRPGKLVDEPVTGKGMMVNDPSVHGSISRHDLAVLALECARFSESEGEVFSVVDEAFLNAPPERQAAVHSEGRS